MQQRVKVCIRVRPTTTSEDAAKPQSNAVAIDEQQQTISVVTNAASGSGTSFRFDQVLSPNVDQAGVFRLVASDVVDGALSGYNGCVLAYGQTGAGKTFTMSGGGPRRRFEDRGLIARALSRVFQRTQQDADHSYMLRVSYLEIYNDRLIDLLAPDVSSSGTGNALNDLAIQEDARGQTFVRGLTTALVSSEEQALDLVFQGDTSRAVAEHALNAASTRSHCIFTLYLERKRSVMSNQFIEEGSGSKLASEERAAYRDEIRRLREELALYDAIAGRTRIQYEGKENAAQEESSRRQQIMSFLVNAELVPPIQSLRQVQWLLHTFRSICLGMKAPLDPQPRKTGSKMVAQIRALRGHTPPGSSQSSAPSSSNYSSNNSDSNNSPDGVGVVLPPIFSDDQRPGKDQRERQERGAPAPSAPRESDKELFDRFKSVGGVDPGFEALRDLEQAKLNLREAKAQYAAQALAVNRVKLEIDGYALQLQELRDRSTPELEDEIEIEHQSVPLLQLQDAKKRYRAEFEQLQEKKAEVGYLGKIKAQMLQQVALQFQAWKDRQEGSVTVASGPGERSGGVH
ncbi:hypothetical protein PF011_g24014 [Phytophthora fragariae]|uniref:Kinesin motor domain-containing protein n=1 Tax=Phytophthora fragariae TaxID=53985 RepID=A0A6A3I8W9_9STRA|nr:hypothetical protein PF011_g24014 [Phytophthora fragariae]